MDNLQGVCKDCGNGTLDNELNPAFDVGRGYVECNRCGSGHVDIIPAFDGSEEEAS